IETTGLSSQYAEITVIGMYLVNGSGSKMLQLVGKEATKKNFLELLTGVGAIYTYNGSRFDLPFIHSSLGIDLQGLFAHHDLMHDCWRCKLYGGFKAVEQKLGIPRQTNGITGWDAVLLWQRYRRHGDRAALDLLLQYNKEDVMNLKVLRERLLLKQRF
ncbi:MAG: ribonuclease H-like domain-containing protein, partial [Dehalococcoidia bacterium]|nr:ribonuclease H-like domain-containing protein [Dehalococcoidia bacterium]